MSVFDDMKSKAKDAFDDHKVSKEQLEHLKDGHNDDKIEQLKQKADLNHDGKLDLKDLEGVSNLDELKKHLLHHD